MVLEESRLIKNDRNNPGEIGLSPSNHFNANKTAFESLFFFSQVPTMLSHIIPRLSALLGLDPNQDIS